MRRSVERWVDATWAEPSVAVQWVTIASSNSSRQVGSWPSSTRCSAMRVSA